MVRIRLRRVGGKKQPSYRIVVADSRAPRDGRIVENIGFYDPRAVPEAVGIDAERALYWLSKGGQPSEAVARILRAQGIMSRFEQIQKGEVPEGSSVEVVSGAEDVAQVAPAETA